MQCPIEDMFVGGARGGGKSEVAIGIAYQHAQRYCEKAVIYIIRRTFPDLEELIDRARAVYCSLGATENRSRHEFTFPDLGGCMIRFRFLARDADASHYQGKNANLIIVDEAGQFPSPTGIDMLWGALRSAAGVQARLVLTGNPGGPGHDWLKRRYVDPVPPNVVQHIKMPTGGVHRRVFIPSYVTDNKLLLENDPGYVDRLYLVGAPWLVRAWLLGDWNVRSEGHFFDIDKLQYGTPPPIRKVYIGGDLATKTSDAHDRAWKDRDYTAFAVVGIDHYRRPWLLDMVRKQMDSAEWTRTLFDLHLKYKPQRIYLEGGGIYNSVEPFLRKMMRERGVPLPIEPVTPSQDKAIRATPMQTIVNSGWLHIPQKNVPWLHDFRTELQVFEPGASRRNEIHDDQVDAAAHVFIKLLELQASADPDALEYRGGDELSRRVVDDGGIDGRVAEALLDHMDMVAKQGRRASTNPADW